MLADLTADAFAEHLGSKFRIDLAPAAPGGPPGVLELELAEVARLEKHAGPREQPFSLFFNSALPGALPQAIYRLRHERLGDLDIFLVPIGPDGRGMRYEAVFN